MKFKIKKILIAILFVISLIINVLSIRNTYAKYQELVDTDYQVGIRKWLISINETDIHDEENEMTSYIVPTLIDNEHMKENVIVPGREGYFEIDLDYTNVDVPFTYAFDIEQTNTNKLSDLDFYGYSIIEQGTSFSIDNVADTIEYLGVEEVTETIDAVNGTKTLEVVQTEVDAETGIEKNRILTATLGTIPGTNAAVVATYTGKPAQVTEKIVDATGNVIEEEKVIFKIEQQNITDAVTGLEKSVYTITQLLDAMKLEDYQRYQNLIVYFKWNDDENNQMDNSADTQYVGDPNPDNTVKNTLLNYKANIKFKQYVEEN